MQVGVWRETGGTGYRRRRREGGRRSMLGIWYAIQSCELLVGLAPLLSLTVQDCKTVEMETINEGRKDVKRGHPVKSRMAREVGKTKTKTRDGRYTARTGGSMPVMKCLSLCQRPCWPIISVVSWAWPFISSPFAIVLTTIQDGCVSFSTLNWIPHNTQISFPHYQLYTRLPLNTRHIHLITPSRPIHLLQVEWRYGHGI